MSDFSFEIVERIGVLSTNSSGWSKEFNIVAFNGGTPKYDIRDWSPDHKKMGKGVSLTKEEAEVFSALVAKMYFDEKENKKEDSEEVKETNSKVVAFKPKTSKATKTTKVPVTEKKKEKVETKKTVMVGNLGNIKLPF